MSYVRAPQAHRPAARKPLPPGASCSPLLVWPVGLALYPEGDLERLHIQVRFRQELLQLRVLCFELLQAPHFVQLQSPELRAPAVERCITESVLPAQLLDRNPGLRFLQKTDDLLLCKTLLLHVRLLL